MERRPLIAGNWKMHTTIAQAETLAAAVADAASRRQDRDVMIAPPFTAVAAVARVLTGSTVLLAGQNVHWEDKGAFTGEISPVMLRDAGAVMAIIGHSERRHVFHETDRMINLRVKGALHAGLVPVFCIGETLDERENGRTMAVLEQQLRDGLAGVSIASADQLVVAYEPVWAIGTGKTATEEQAQQAHAFVRSILAALFEKTVAGHMRILYGGSVKPDNIDALMREADIDGALVGGAALTVDSFVRLINFEGRRIQ